MSKVFKGIKKAASKIWKGAKKVFKKIVTSKIFKVLLIAAAIFVVGGMAGAWATPWSGAAAGAETAAAAATTAETAAATTAAAETAAAGTVAAETAAATAAPAVAPVAAGASAPVSVGVPQIVSNLSATEMAAQTGQTITQGIMETLVGGAKSAFAFADKHPFATSLGMQALGGILSPDEKDLQEGQWRREDEERRRQQKNMDVSGIDIGHRPARETGRAPRESGAVNPINANMAQGV